MIELPPEEEELSTIMEVWRLTRLGGCADMVSTCMAAAAPVTFAMPVKPSMLRCSHEVVALMLFAADCSTDKAHA